MNNDCGVQVSVTLIYKRFEGWEAYVFNHRLDLSALVSRNWCYRGFSSFAIFGG
jgi:hypothetical protein